MKGIEATSLLYCTTAIKKILLFGYVDMVIEKYI